MTDNPIAAANDAFRKAFHPLTGDWVSTFKVKDLGPHVIAAATSKIVKFDAFTPDNDPYGEHDFGSLVVNGHKLFWKIDCYDRERPYESLDPAYISSKRRVLTIMLASEY